MPIIRCKHSGYSRDGVRRVFFSGGGGGDQKSTSYTTNVPEYAREPFMNLVGKSEALSNQPYQPFSGQRIQGFNPMQQQSFQNAAGQTTAGQIGAGSGLAAIAGMQGLQAGNYQPQQVGTQSFLQGQNAQNYMSPYMQNVIDIQKREAMRDAGIATTQRNSQAVKAGAFGGSRQAIMDAEAGRNLGMQLGDIQSRGLQSAYDQAQRQFNTEQQLGLQGQTANQQAGLEGQRLGLSGLGVALQGAGTLGQLGQQQFGQQMDITQMLNTLGGQQQQLGQKQLDQQYADFQAQRDYPYQQLGFLSDILRGTSGSTRTMYSSQPQASGLQTLAGLGTAAAGFGRMFKEGGLVEGIRYAAGGGVAAPALIAQLSQMSDQGLQQYTQMHKEDPYTVALAVSESRRRKQLRDAAANAQNAGAPQGTVIEREMAGMVEPMDMGIAAAVPEEAVEMADGGIVGYADGGELDAQRQQDREMVARFGRAAWEQMKRAGAAIADVGTMPVRGLAGAYDTAVVRPMRAAGVDAAYLSPSLVPEGADVDSMTPFYDLFRKKDAEGGVSPYGLGNEGRREPMPPLPPKAGLAAAVEKEAAPGEPQARIPQVGGSVGLRTSRSAGAGLGALVPNLGADEMMSEGQRRIDAMTKADRAALEQEEADLLAQQKEQGVYGADKEKRLKEQEAGLEGKERDSKNMALIQAGLAILSADPSRGAFAAIGEGALKGVGAYKGDMEKIEAQREKVGTQMDELLELRRQESNAQGKERAAIRSRIRSLAPAAERSAFELWKGVGVPLKMEQAKLTFQAALKQREMENATANARIAASGGGRPNATLETAQAYAASKKIPLYQALQELGAKGGGFDTRAEYADYLKSYKPDPLNPGSGPMTYGAYARMFPPPTVSAVPGQGATIRP